MRLTIDTIAPGLTPPVKLEASLPNFMNTPLTKETIEKATGRELDGLIGLRLFGWQWWQSNKKKLSVLLPPADSGLVRHNFSEKVFTQVTAEEGNRTRYVDWDHNDLPRYSTTGDGMLLVLEKMRERGWHCCTEGELQHQWSAYFYHDGQPTLPGAAGDVWRADADTLPEAICRAVLLVFLSSDNP